MSLRLLTRATRATPARLARPLARTLVTPSQPATASVTEAPKADAEAPAGEL
jgi:hypothetical protein